MRLPLETRLSPPSLPIDDPDQEAVLADDAPRLLVTAPPGSGKTHTAIRLVARDLDIGRVGPTQRALVMTFSRQARAQLTSYGHMVFNGDAARRVEITNYHQWFWSKIWAFRSSLGLPAELALSTRAEQREDVEAAMLAAGLPQITVASRWQDYARAGEFAVPHARPPRLEHPLDRGDDVAAHLAERHRQLGRIHYDDMAHYAWRLLDESQTLRRIWAHKYPVMVLDEYQDASPLQALISERLAAAGTRLYAFADPLQMIYGFRDASPARIPEFRDWDASCHELRTLHRYRHQPALQRWMEGVRDVLLNDAPTCPPPPAEVTVLRYAPDRDNKIRSEPYDTHSRDLWRIDDHVSNALRTDALRRVAVLVRKNSHFARIERHLSSRYYPRRLRAAEDTAEWARSWLDRYATSVGSLQLRAEHLLEVAQRVAPRNADVADLATRLEPAGIRAARLRNDKRILADRLNALLPQYDTLPGALRAAVTAAGLAVAQDDPKQVADDAFYVVRQAFGGRGVEDETEAREHAIARLTALRFRVEDDTRAGLYLLTCHSGKGKEFDTVIIPYLSSEIFPDDQDGRQLLYVSLTRARKRLIVRSAVGRTPDFAQKIGLA